MDRCLSSILPHWTIITLVVHVANFAWQHLLQISYDWHSLSINSFNKCLSRSATSFAEHRWYGTGRVRPWVPSFKGNSVVPLSANNRCWLSPSCYRMQPPWDMPYGLLPSRDWCRSGNCCLELCQHKEGPGREVEGEPANSAKSILGLVFPLCGTLAAQRAS